jgi:hypothetical protein
MFGSEASGLPFVGSLGVKMSPVVLMGGIPLLSAGFEFDCANRLILAVSIKAMQPNFESVIGILSPIGAIVG